MASKPHISHESVVAWTTTMYDDIEWVRAGRYAELVELYADLIEQYEVAKRERDEIGAAFGEPCAECGHIDWRSDGYLEDVEQEWLRLAGVQAARAEELQEQLQAARNTLLHIATVDWSEEDATEVLDDLQVLAAQRAEESTPASASERDQDGGGDSADSRSTLSRSETPAPSPARES